MNRAEVARLSAYDGRRFDPFDEARAVIIVDRDGGIRAASAEAGRTSVSSPAPGLADFVGHELRNPLTVITTYAELVLDRHGDELDPETRSHLRRIVGAADRMRGSIDGVTSLFRDGDADAVAPIDTGAMVRDVVQQLPDLPGAVDVGLLPVVRARPGQLRLVFENLIGNAVKYRDPSTPLRIRIRALRSGRHVRFSVTDNGIGIAAKDRRRVFEPAYRSAPGGDIEGTGLGLTLCRRVVRQHGGAIWVDCGPSSGTRICFTIPDRTN